MSNKIKLGDYCDIIKGGIGIQKAIPGEFPLVVTAEERLTHNEYQFDNTAVIIPLVSSTGHGHASIKRLHYQEGKFALGTILCAVIIRDTTIINPRYLYIYLSYFKDHLLVPLMKGAANVTLSIKKIKEVEIILPSLERQLEIIELEKNNDLVEDLENEIQTQKQLLTKLKQSILQEAIQGKLTADWRKQNPNTEPASELLKRIKAEKDQLIKDKKIKKEKSLSPITGEEIPFELPDGWVWCRLGDINNIFLGGAAFSSSRFISDSNIQVIRISNVKNDELNTFKNPVYIDEKNANENLRNELFAGDILTTMTGTREKRDYCFTVELNSSHFINKRLFLNQRVGCFRINTNINSTFSSLALKSQSLLEPVFQSSTGSANQANISKDALLNILFPLPPIKEQQAIVEKVETLMQKCQALEQEIKTSEANTQMLMQAVLKEAFEGKQELVEV